MKTNSYSLRSTKWLAVLAVAIYLPSCQTYKKMYYLEGAPMIGADSLAMTKEIHEPIIKPNDILSITVNSEIKGAAEDFNLSILPAGSNLSRQTQVDNSSGYSGTLQNYLVDKEGNINFPVLGSMKLGGMTIRESQEHIVAAIYPQYIASKPIVNVRQLNFTVSVLGEVKNPGIYKVDNGMMTILDALAAAGDMTIDLLTYSNQFIYGISDTEYINLNKHNLKAWIFGHWHINFIRKQGDVLAISTAPPDKGGIDHSLSAFRVIHTDGKGNFRSELRYPYIEQSITINSISDHQATYLPSGNVSLSANIYFTDSPVKEVAYIYFSENKQIGIHRMRRQTDWNWHAELALPPQFIGKEITVTVQAFFKNGETTEATESFIYNGKSPSTIQPGYNWTNLSGNPQHTGISPDTLHLPLSLAWITNVQANIFMTSPLVYNGNVYIASTDENLLREAHIYALNATDGAIRWKYNVRNSIKNSIAADKGHIFAQDAEGYLYAVDAVTGELVWEKKLKTNGLPALVEGLVAADGVVYAGTGRGLCASDAVTGKTLWTNSGWEQHEGSTTTLSLAKNTLVSGSQWHALLGNDTATGQMRWSNNKNGLSNRGASAAIHGNRLYIVSLSSLFILDLFTGEVIVRKDRSAVRLLSQINCTFPASTFVKSNDSV